MTLDVFFSNLFANAPVQQVNPSRPTAHPIPRVVPKANPKSLNCLSTILKPNSGGTRVVEHDATRLILQPDPRPPLFPALPDP